MQGLRGGGWFEWKGALVYLNGIISVSGRGSFPPAAGVAVGGGGVWGLHSYA